MTFMRKPYLWRGVPGWDPAKAVESAPRERECPVCNAKPGEGCLGADGKRRNYHKRR